MSGGDSAFHLPPAESSPKTAATWICTICSFSNPVPSNFDPTTASVHTPLAPCLSCGVKPLLTHVLKAAISNATKRSVQTQSPSATLTLRDQVESPGSKSNFPHETAVRQSDTTSSSARGDSGASAQCPRCTFLNDPSLMSCEMCGAPLLSESIVSVLDASSMSETPRAESPGPSLSLPPAGKVDIENIKLSFRGGGEKIFYERLKGCLVQRKWLLQGAPPVPKPNRRSETASGSTTPTSERRNVGIAGLEQRRLEVRKNNELVIGNAFEDLEALMASAKEIIALAESFANGNDNGSESNAVADALGLVTTRDMLGGSNSESLYISELSRNLAEFLTDDARGVLRKSGGIISLVDLWAMFNRARGGVELVSPLDFEKAARMWEQLKLPLRLRQFKSGVLVVQGSDRTDNKTIQALLSWLNDLHNFPPDKELSWDWQNFGRGVTARDAAERFGWSIGVAEEELEMAEEKGALCREESLEGLTFWENWIDESHFPSPVSQHNNIV